MSITRGIRWWVNVPASKTTFWGVTFDRHYMGKINIIFDKAVIDPIDPKKYILFLKN